MTVGMMTLAVPALGELRRRVPDPGRRLQAGLGLGRRRCGGIVLAAMYSLRLISAVLHQDVGPAVREESLDLRFGELAVVVPLVAILLALLGLAGRRSASTRSATEARDAARTGDSVPRRRHDRQAAGRLVRALAGRSRCSPRRRLPADAVAVFTPRRTPAASSRRSSVSPASSPPFVLAVLLDVRARTGRCIVADSMFRDRWAALAQVLIAGFGLVAVLVS